MESSDSQEGADGEEKDELDLLNLSLHEMSLGGKFHYANLIRFGCHNFWILSYNFITDFDEPTEYSTPTKSSSKQPLSPSKTEREPPAKRVRMKGTDCRKQQEHLRDVLQENFVESPGKMVSQEDVMTCLEVEFQL